MRYSIVHHDVRRKFDLTFSEYLVCDSIHQLSHSAPTKKTDTDISEFLGMDRSHVGHCRRRLMMKGLVHEIGEGYSTDSSWWESVTYEAGKIPTKRGNSPKSGDFPRDTTYKEYKEDNSEIVISQEDEKPRREKKDTEYLKIFALWGKYPLAWRSNKTEQQAAKNLLEERSIEDIKDSIRYADKHKHEQFCPVINSPYDLDSKWTKLEAFYAKRV